MNTAMRSWREIAAYVYGLEKLAVLAFLLLLVGGNIAPPSVPESNTPGLEWALHERVLFKSNAAQRGMADRTWEMAEALSLCFLHEGKAPTVTASSNGRHARNSLHYRDAALDLRMKRLRRDERERIMECAESMGLEFKIKWRPLHAHVTGGD